MTKILDGKVAAKTINQDLKKRVQKLQKQNITPCLAVILVGNDPASKIYVERKEAAAREIGIKTQTYTFEQTLSEEQLLNCIQELNQNSSIHGILVQFPLPKHIDEAKVVRMINVEKDVDAFHPMNVGYLVEGFPELTPCTPTGIMELLKMNQIDVSGKHCVVVGRSSIVGKPMSLLLLQNNATVTICHSKTQNLETLTKQADIIVLAIGKANYLQPNMIKDGVILIDVGMNRTNSGLVGDIDAKCYSKASWYTPVPGGVGPMTIAMLMKQTVEIAERGK